MNEPVTTTDALAALCVRLHSADFVTVDTEFHREKTYYPELCLVQVAGPEEAAIIDPLAPGIDLTPLYELLRSPVLKVFHAARQDLEIFFRLMGELPAPLFDTQIAAMALGFGESASYETLVSQLARAQLDKSSRFTDWMRRPLTDRQLDYAIGDVTHLRVVYRKLTERLENRGRAGWIAEEMQTLVDPALYRVDPEEQWKRLRLRTRSPRFLNLLRALCAWREREAIRKNFPRQRVLKDDALLEIAAQYQTPGHEGGGDGLPALRSGTGHVSARQKEELAALLAEASATSPETWPRLPEPEPLNPAQESALALLRMLMKLACAEHGIAPKLIGDTDALEALARGRSEHSPLLSGWRREAFGEKAEKLLSGRLWIGFGPAGIEIREGA